jgi:hypothetical protein
MVHALEKVHNLLKAGGLLVDLHPSAEAVAIDVLVDGTPLPAGWLKETDEGIEYLRADEALARVVGDRLFEMQGQERTPFARYADNLEDLLEYLAEAWKDAFLDDTTLRRVRELLAQPAGRHEIVVRETLVVSALRASERAGMDNEAERGW